MSEKYYNKYVILAVDIHYLQLKSPDFAKLSVEFSVELANRVCDLYHIYCISNTKMAKIKNSNIQNVMLVTDI